MAKNTKKKRKISRIERDCWALDIAAAQWFLPRLHHIRCTKYGVPSMMYDKKNLINPTKRQDSAAELKWFRILDSMIAAMEAVKNSNGIAMYSGTRPRVIEKGLKNLAKYFLCLWT